jgi:hypothetical protein
VKFNLVETDPKSYEKSAMDLCNRDDQQRTPYIIIGGSRGDREIFYKQELMQIYERIKKEELQKL